MKFSRYDLRHIPLLRGLIYHKFYVDEMYDALFVQPLLRLSQKCALGVDVKIVDAMVMGLSRGFVRIGHWACVMQNTYSLLCDGRE